MTNFDFTQGYKGQVTVVSTKGSLFTRPETCKDYVHDAIMHAIWPVAAKAINVSNVGLKGAINLETPTFVLWTSPKKVERNAAKFAQFMNQIESIMGLRMTVAHPVATGITTQSAPFIAEADSWWMKSPVGVSAYLLFLRLAIAMRLNESFESCIDRITSGKHDSKNAAIGRDAGYLTMAKKKGHLTGLLEKSLPCFNREDYSDYLVSSHGRGFSMYSLKADESIPMTTDKLISYMESKHGQNMR